MLFLLLLLLRRRRRFQLELSGFSDGDTFFLPASKIAPKSGFCPSLSAAIRRRRLHWKQMCVVRVQHPRARQSKNCPSISMCDCRAGTGWQPRRQAGEAARVVVKSDKGRRRDAEERGREGEERGLTKTYGECSYMRGEVRCPSISIVVHFLLLCSFAEDEIAFS